MILKQDRVVESPVTALSGDPIPPPFPKICDLPYFSDVISDDLRYNNPVRNPLSFTANSPTPASAGRRGLTAEPLPWRSLDTLAEPVAVRRDVAEHVSLS